jgi:hypothetical protein
MNLNALVGTIEAQRRCESQIMAGQHGASMQSALEAIFYGIECAPALERCHEAQKAMAGFVRAMHRFHELGGKIAFVDPPTDPVANP